MQDSENNWLGWVIIIGVIWGGYYLFSDNSTTESDAQYETSYSSSRNSYYEDEEPATFNGYDCTDDCSGHEAGYNWAEENGIYDENDCGGNSNSFIEGCISYTEEN